MPDQAQWDYRVVSAGSFWSTKDEALEASLNELGQAGWEVVSAQSASGTSKVTLIAKRPRAPATRQRREWEAFPGARR